MEIVKYESSIAEIWDRFIEESKNGNFLFKRQYLEYHADRFTDYSLICYDENGRLVAVMPASVSDDVITSHGGLTYGGLISGTEMKTATMVKVFGAVLAFLKREGIE